jgi:crotonobetainyl-CoA:carnitine CoA-transferase CaiB-like acyl-CoA transferase
MTSSIATLMCWPEAMMQYTVVGHEHSASDPKARPDLIFTTLDGYITAGTISDSEWQGFCRAADRPDLADDKRFNSPGARTANGAERITLMGEILATRTTADWLARLDAADVPCAPVLRRGEVIANEQVVARGLISEFDHPGIGRVRQPKPAAEFSGTPTRPPSPAPRIGEHGRQILVELGYLDAEIDRLGVGKVVRM